MNKNSSIENQIGLPLSHSDDTFEQVFTETSRPTKELESEYRLVEEKIASLPADEADLNTALPFNQSLVCNNYELDTLCTSLVEMLIAHLGLKKPSRIKYFTRTKVLLLNMLKAIQVHEGWISISKNKNEYSACYYEHVSYQYLIVNNLNVLEQIGLIETVIGVYYDDLKRHTRIRAIGELAEALVALDIQPLAIHEDYRLQQTIILKEEKQWEFSKRLKRSYRYAKRIPYIDNEFSSNARDNLKLLNKEISTRWIDLYVTDDEFEAINSSLLAEKDDYRTVIDFSSKMLCRIFNNSSFDHGGRFYGGWWEQIPSKWRPFITINNCLTVECDYSSLHPELVYSLNNRPRPEGDLYTIEGLSNYGVDRDSIKLATLIIINATDEDKALSAIERHEGIALENIQPDEFLASLIDKHSEISDRLFTGYGTTLQNIDSEIAERLMLRAVKELKTVILPVHDSFIIQHDYTDWLKEAMNEAYSEKAGRDIGTKFNLDFHDSPYGIEDNDTNRELRSGYFSRQSQWIEIHSNNIPPGIEGPENNNWYSPDDDYELEFIDHKALEKITVPLSA